MVDYSNIPRDSRRVPLETRVQFKFDRFSGFISEYSANISPGGIFLRTHQPRPAGTALELEFRLGDGFELIKGRGEVIWAREEDDGPGRPAGMGIRFLELSEGSRELIYRIVDQHILQGGTPFDVTQRPPEPAPSRNASLPSVSDLFASPPASPAPQPPHLPAGRPASAPATFAPTFGSASLHPPPRRVLPWVLAATVLLLAAGAWLLRDRLPGGSGGRANAAPEARRAAASRPAGAAATAAPEPAPPVSPAVPPPGPPAVAGEPGAGPPLSRLDRVTWEPVAGGTDVILWGDGAIPPEAYKRARLEGNPPRELIRLSGVQGPHAQARVLVGTPEVLQIRMGYHPEIGGGELHVVLDLAHPTVAVTGVVQEPHRLRLHLQRQ